jgi:hypothetical protein
MSNGEGRVSILKPIFAVERVSLVFCFLEVASSNIEAGDRMTILVSSSLYSVFLAYFCMLHQIGPHWLLPTTNPT